MKCHYTYDKETGEKFFIPMCYGTIHTLNKEDCHCPDPLTEHSFEKKLFNEILKNKNQTIKDQQFEIKNLMKVIENLKNGKISKTNIGSGILQNKE